MESMIQLRVFDQRNFFVVFTGGEHFFITAGYHKGIDLLALWMQRADLTFSPALKKLKYQVRKKVTIRCINRQRFAEEMQILREIFNSGWQHNWGFVPFTEHE